MRENRDRLKTLRPGFSNASHAKRTLEPRFIRPWFTHEKPSRWERKRKKRKKKIRAGRVSIRQRARGSLINSTSSLVDLIIKSVRTIDPSNKAIITGRFSPSLSFSLSLSLDLLAHNHRCANPRCTAAQLRYLFNHRVRRSFLRIFPPAKLRCVHRR